jgi:hypothetical protein
MSQMRIGSKGHLWCGVAGHADADERAWRMSDDAARRAGVRSDKDLASAPMFQAAPQKFLFFSRSETIAAVSVCQIFSDRRPARSPSARLSPRRRSECSRKIAGKSMDPFARKPVVSGEARAHSHQRAHAVSPALFFFAAADSVVARVLTSRISRAYKTPTERGAVLALGQDRLRASGAPHF